MCIRDRSESAPLILTIYNVRKYKDYRKYTPNEEVYYENDNDHLWNEKLEEIHKLKKEKENAQLTEEQVEKLINVYNKYRHMFSDTPGKVKNYQCEIKFREPVNFNRKSYPIAYSLKEAVRAEISRLLNEDIIEHSHSPYTLSLIHI